MFTDEHLGRGTAEVKPPTQFGARHLNAEGRGFNRAKNQLARFLLRCLTRAKFSPFTLHQPLLTTHITNHAFRGGTVSRPRTHLSHRKQTIGHMQRRNFPVQFLSPVSPRFLSAGLTFLPGTVNRVEAHASYTKQTMGHAATRNVPAHHSFRRYFASAVDSIGVPISPARAFLSTAKMNPPASMCYDSLLKSR
jgi:hypothetical protein